MIERDPEYIKSFLDRVGRSWALGPDQRFGQFVSNVVGHHRDPDGSEAAVVDITDDDFSRALDKFEEGTRRRREEFERTLTARLLKVGEAVAIGYLLTRLGLQR